MRGRPDGAKDSLGLGTTNRPLLTELPLTTSAICQRSAPNVFEASEHVGSPCGDFNMDDRMS